MSPKFPLEGIVMVPNAMPVGIEDGKICINSEGVALLARSISCNDILDNESLTAPPTIHIENPLSETFEIIILRVESRFSRRSM